MSMMAMDDTQVHFNGFNADFVLRIVNRNLGRGEVGGAVA
jgi:hypothetical protein